MTIPFHIKKDGPSIFEGRKKILTQLQKDIFRTNLSITAITGIAGVGKTSLAIQFAYEYKERFPDGVFLISMEDEDSVQQEIYDLRVKMGIIEDAKMTVGSVVDQIHEKWGKGGNYLIIFDNCESPDLFNNWKLTEGNAKILITSRYQQWHRFKSPKIIQRNLEVFSIPESVNFLRSFTRRIDKNSAKEIATTLDCHPLALYLAARHLEDYEQVSCEEFIKDLKQQRLDHRALQGDDPNKDPDKTFSVFNVFNLSYERLKSTENQKLYLLTMWAMAILSWSARNYEFNSEFFIKVFKNLPLRFNPDVTDYQDVFTKLVNLGFVRLIHHNTNIQVHSLVLDYMRKVLTNEKYTEELEDGFKALSFALIDIVQSCTETRNIKDLPPYLPYIIHLTKITPNTFANENIRATLLTYLGFSLYRQQEYYKAYQYCEEALKINSSIQPTTPVEIARDHYHLGEILYRQGKFDEAKNHLEQAVNISNMVSLPHLYHPGKLALYLNSKGVFLEVVEENFKEAQKSYEDALAKSKVIYGNKDARTAIILNNLSILCETRKNFIEAIKYGEQALAIRREIAKGQDDPNVAETLVNLGNARTGLGRKKNDETSQGYFLEAKKNYQEALAMAIKIFGTTHRLVGEDWSSLGYVEHIMGNYEIALQHYYKNLHILRNFLKKERGFEFQGDESDLALPFNNIGEAWLDWGKKEDENNTPQANKYYQIAYRYLKKAYEIGATTYGLKDKNVKDNKKLLLAVSQKLGIESETKKWLKSIDAKIKKLI